MFTKKVLITKLSDELNAFKAKANLLNNDKAYAQYRAAEMCYEVICNTPLTAEMLQAFSKKDKMLLDVLTYLSYFDCLSASTDKIAEMVQQYLANQEQKVLSNKLYFRLKNEYLAWFEKIHKSSKQEIIRNAYNLTLFENIVDLMSDDIDFLNVSELRSLLSCKNTLFAIQRAWNNWDKSIYSEMRHSISKLAWDLSQQDSCSKAA